MHREPLRTIVEMAEEFGVTRSLLAQRIGTRHGPKHEIACRGAKFTPGKTYYVPSTLRKWWREIGSKP